MKHQVTKPKRWLTATLLVFFMAVGCHATNYVVFYVKGDVKSTLKGKTETVKERMVISDKDVFELAKGSSLILKDESNNRLPVAKGPCKGKIEKLVKKGKGSFIQRSKEFFAQLIGRSHSDMKAQVDYMRTVGSVVHQSPVENEDGMVIRKREPKVLIDNDLMDAFVDVEAIINELEKE